MLLIKECPMCGKEVAIRMGEDEYDRFFFDDGLLQDILPNMGAVEREFLKTGYCHSCQKKIFGSFNKPNMEMWVDAELLELAKKIFGYCPDFEIEPVHLDHITSALANADKEFLESLKNAETEEEYLALEIPNNETLEYYMQNGKESIKVRIEIDKIMLL